ncbi:tetratricopeptide repeat protein [Aequorivita sp. H23M31]|uniref:Tetratricopeptide repeat protein n=1 Tax=Aequorivita ciconiae TaxID=2494375 RepID=A0A410G5W5_9FLAO|nr:tetratricopeptide repeat protein [Aequorivita sp. H23M31]QAA82653.1 tetratricopeptide repeat protein [Aequorivita sp. H23M31]
MKIEFEEWNAIETYLEKNEAGEVTAHLKQSLDQIPNLDEKIKYVKETREDIEDCIRMSKIKEFQTEVDVDEEVTRKPKIKRLKMSVFFYSVAATLIVLFGIFWMLNTKTPGEKIFAENFKPDIGLPLKMSTIGNYGFYEGMLDYKQENYKEAIAKWNTILPAKPHNDTLNYFLGVANLALGNTVESLEYLRNQELYKGGMFEQEAAYYAALAEIKDGNFKKAEILLRNNPSPDNDKLLKQLENQ